MIIKGTVGKVDLVIDTAEWPAPTKNMMSGGICSIIQKTPPSATITYLQKVHELLADLPQGMSVLELFGGIGLFPKVLGPTLHPAEWVSIDWDDWCQKNFLEPRAEFVLRDVYSLTVDELSGRDLIIIDNGYTLFRYTQDQKLFKLMEKVAQARPEYYEVTDLGYFWGHLHKKTYFREFGININTKEDYTNLFISKWKEWFGYDFVRYTVGGGAQYFLFKR